MKEGNENEKGKKRRDVEALLLLSLRRRGMCEEAELNARRVRERERERERVRLKKKKKRDSGKGFTFHRRFLDLHLPLVHSPLPPSPLPHFALVRPHGMSSRACSLRSRASMGSSRSSDSPRAVPSPHRFPALSAMNRSTSSTLTSVVRSTSPSSLSPSSTRLLVVPRALSRPLDPPSAPATADSDPELLEVLEMCDDAELENVWGLLTGEREREGERARERERGEERSCVF